MTKKLIQLLLSSSLKFINLDLRKVWYYTKGKKIAILNYLNERRVNGLGQLEQRILFISA